MAAQIGAPQLQSIPVLTQRLYDADPDIRFMSLNDLLTTFNNPIHSQLLTGDFTQCAKLVDGFLHTLSDTNGDVQNMTIKCIGPFVRRSHPEVLCPMIHKLGQLEEYRGVDNTIPALAIRAVVISLPRPRSGAGKPKAVNDAYIAISKVLIPRLVGYIVLPRGDTGRPDPPKGLLQEDLETGSDRNVIDVLIEIARCFGPMLHQSEVTALQKIIMELIESPRTASVMKKKAVSALSTLAHFFSETMLSGVVSKLIERLRDPHLTPSHRRLYISVLGSLARSVPDKFGPHLRTITPFVIAPLSQKELDEQMAALEEDNERDPLTDEARDAALVALESFMTSYNSEMRRYASEVLDCTLRFLRYDPNVADDVDDDENSNEDATSDEDFEVDEDFEEEAAEGDEDDISWRVRRAAAKTLHTIIDVRGKEIIEDRDLYHRIAAALIARFTEREESVRHEILENVIASRQEVTRLRCRH